MCAIYINQQVAQISIRPDIHLFRQTKDLVHCTPEEICHLCCFDIHPHIHRTSLTRSLHGIT